MNAIERAQVKQELQELALGKSPHGIVVSTSGKSLILMESQKAAQILECWEAMEEALNKAGQWREKVESNLRDLLETLDIDL